ncbi:unnamed protein product [Schistosoma mattheei]|uniref:Uncharacterized protein n=1 Tax=Schistosoma mattheei TaxID=31246 RepID=A0A3P7ZXY2_9TREM|nr:unnamed protein product [Schistosoma mattheei]
MKNPPVLLLSIPDALVDQGPGTVPGRRWSVCGHMPCICVVVAPGGHLIPVEVILGKTWGVGCCCLPGKRFIFCPGHRDLLPKLIPGTEGSTINKPNKIQNSIMNYIIVLTEMKWKTNYQLIPYGK